MVRRWLLGNLTKWLHEEPKDCAARPSLRRIRTTFIKKSVAGGFRCNDRASKRKRARPPGRASGGARRRNYYPREAYRAVRCLPENISLPLLRAAPLNARVRPGSAR